MDDIESGVPGYATVKQAASMLGLSPSRVYEYVEDGRLSHVRAAHVILIPVGEIKNFKTGIAGRPRKSLLRWRISPDNNVLLSMRILVRVKAGKLETLRNRLEEIRRGGEHLFPGTIARFIVGSETKYLEIVLIWRSTVTSDECRDKALAEFRDALVDVLDWNSAEYSSGQVLMHA